MTVQHTARVVRISVGKLHAWYRKTARDLPWRNTTDPYAIWVSEVMLQQTQVKTVIPYYERWMERFPTVNALSMAEEDEVLRAWQGLGYYSRARNFHRAAKQISTNFNGVVPSRWNDLRALPGIGDYTASAIASIAFHHDVPTIDGNVERVLARVFAFEGDPKAKEGRAQLAEFARMLLPTGKANIHNQAMMELGARICTPRSPHCNECPLSAMCVAYRDGSLERFPFRRVRKAVPHQKLLCAIAFDRTRILLDRRPEQGMLAGLWDLPHMLCDEETDPSVQLAAMLRKRFGVRVQMQERLDVVRHVYSHLKVTLHPFVCIVEKKLTKAAEQTPSWTWIAPRQLDNYALTRACQKVLALKGLMQVG